MNAKPIMRSPEYRRALALHGSVERQLCCLQADGAKNRDSIVLLRGCVRTGRYLHYKSTDAHPRRHAVLGVSLGPSGDCWVIHAPLYGPEAGEMMSMPLVGERSFLLPVLKDGYQGPRYTLERAFSLPMLTHYLVSYN